MATENDDLNIHINVDPSGAEQGSNRAKSAIGGIGNEAKQLESSFRRLMSAIDPTFAAQEKYNQSLSEARQLWSAGRISVEEYRQGVAAARTELQASIEAINNNSAAARAAAAQIKQAAADEAAAARQAAREKIQAAAQAAAARRQALKEETAAAREAAEVTRRQGIETRALANTERELRSAIDPLYAAQVRYNATMQQATQLLMANKLRAGEFTAIQKNAAQQMEINARSLGRMNTGYVQLGYQAQDVVASLASGISPLVILAQQGGQTAAAMSQMGGKMSGVATFMAGPWGAAILGAVMVLGMLIPKLFDTESASDAAAAGQKRFADMVDSATGSIKTQITWLERLAEANRQAKDAEKQRTQASEDSRKLMFNVAQAISPQTISGGYGQTIEMPAEVQGKSQQWIKAWVAAVKAGRMETTELAARIARLGNLDPSVAGLSKRVVELGGGINKINREAETADARRAQLLGKQLTDRQKLLLDIKDTTSKTTEAELRANVDLAVSTDMVEKARAKLTIAEAQATRTRATMIAQGKTQKEADQAYMDGIKGATAELQKAEAAKEAANKAAAAGRRQDRADAAAAKRELKEQQQFVLEDLDYRRDLAQDDFAEQMRLQDEKVAKLKEFYGEDSRNYVQGLREKERMTRQHNQVLLQIERDRVRTQNDIAQAREESDFNISQTGFAAGQDQTKAMASMGQLNPRQEIEARRTQLNEMYQMQIAHEERMYQLKLSGLQQQLALLPRESAEHASVNNQILMLEAQHQMTERERAASHFRDMAQLNLEAAQLSYNKWKEVTDSVAQSFGQMFQGIWMRSGNFKQNLLNIADQLVFKFVNSALQMASSWIAGEATKTNATVAGNAIRTSAAVAGASTQTAVSSAAASTEIANSAATAAAGAYKSTVVIPFIGPVSAPAAAALALATVMGFSALLSARGGLGEVEADGQPALLHKKEMVLPAWIAEPFRQSLKSPQSSAGLFGGAAAAGSSLRSSTTNNGDSYAFHYQPKHTNMGASMDTLLRNDGRALRKWIRNEVKNGSLKLK